MEIDYYDMLKIYAFVVALALAGDAMPKEHSPHQIQPNYAQMQPYQSNPLKLEVPRNYQALDSKIK